ncbi:uncharacterized protein PHACADRAFT_252521 [Phanerochaete carnosa HHB-10118-sp]|uniref:Uncharacterized protein n=1 Tax=Phanerochaete carnosa (strain HHB-10118-sp) TaxID=650164 RepID=K5X655_PHACS|nr:uncharacterized protein PHACADRAFT_252521 [Phanerochaete carnosa HHB-10118-sp]EKM58307.1 hypothetical protein PHACADRAFT_252521 [Phanerochaete carnosa HHB-10118-sp]
MSSKTLTKRRSKAGGRNGEGRLALEAFFIRLRCRPSKKRNSAVRGRDLPNVSRAAVKKRWPVMKRQRAALSAADLIFSSTPIVPVVLWRPSSSISFGHGSKIY